MKLDNLITFSVRPAEPVGAALERLLPEIERGVLPLSTAIATLGKLKSEQPEDPLSTVIDTVEKLRAAHPDDHRLGRLVQRLERIHRRESSPRMTPERLQKAFRSVADIIEPMIEARRWTQLLEMLPKIEKGELPLSTAIDTLDELRARHSEDDRLKMLVERLRRLQERASSQRLTSERLRKAFNTVADIIGPRIEAKNDTQLLVWKEGGVVRRADRRLIRAVNHLAEIPLKLQNAPVAAIIAVDGKVLSVGLNRAYFPVRKWNGHAETEALQGLDQMKYAGMVQLLRRYQARNAGNLSPETVDVLAELGRQGVDEPPVFRDTDQDLEAGGFFTPEKIASYEKTVLAFLGRDGSGAAPNILDPYWRTLAASAIEDENLPAASRPEWSLYDRLDRRDPSLRLDLYSTLEPCGMCAQNAVSYGMFGRFLWSAFDEQGGGLSWRAKKHSNASPFPPLYKIPAEMIGGIEPAAAQARFDRWFHEVYQKLRLHDKR